MLTIPAEPDCERSQPAVGHAGKPVLGAGHTWFTKTPLQGCAWHAL